MKRFIICITIAAACWIPFTFAEVNNIDKTVAMSTNATSTLGATLYPRGIIHRAIITVSTGGTGVVELIDADSTVIWTNATAAGVTSISTNFPASGVLIKTYGANSTNKTVKVSLTVEQ